MSQAAYILLLVTYLEVAVLELWDGAIRELMDFYIKYRLICICRKREREIRSPLAPAHTHTQTHYIYQVPSSSSTTS
jgi:hypothetical protein